jgi:hypothetical protein
VSGECLIVELIIDNLNISKVHADMQGVENRKFQRVFPVIFVSADMPG